MADSVIELPTNDGLVPLSAFQSLDELSALIDRLIVAEKRLCLLQYDILNKVLGIEGGRLNRLTSLQPLLLLVWIQSMGIDDERGRNLRLELWLLNALWVANPPLFNALVRHLTVAGSI